MSRRSLASLLAVPVLAVALIGCSALIPVSEPTSSTREPAPTTQESQPSTPEPTSSEAPDDGLPDYEAAFAERDQFLRDQQLSADPSSLVAVTAPQNEYIAQQRAHIEAQGGQWSPQHEAIYLALAVDACETSILNFHELTALTAQTHIATSPLFQMLLQGQEGPQRAAAEQNLTSVMVFGTGFLCPADEPQWQAAYRELYG